MVGKWHKTLDKGDETRTVLINLSKAFDCVDHNLIIAKLNPYGFEKQSINFIYSYLIKRKQKTKVDSVVSSWKMLFSGVPQGSVFRTTFIQYIQICDTFFWYASKKSSVYWLCWICRWQYSLHVIFKHRKWARQFTRSIRKTVSLVVNKSLGSKCRKILPFNKL